MKNRHHRFAAILSAAALATLASAGYAWAPEVKTLTPPRVELREGKGPAYKVVATAKQGEKVTVLDTDAKGWLLLERETAAGGGKGYVHARALEVKAADPNAANLSQALAGRSDKPEITAAAAAKGIEPQTQIYAGYKGYNTAGLTELKRRRDAVTADEYLQFIAALKAGR